MPGVLPATFIFRLLLYSNIAIQPPSVINGTNQIENVMAITRTRDVQLWSHRDPRGVAHIYKPTTHL